MKTSPAGINTSPFPHCECVQQRGFDSVAILGRRKSQTTAADSKGNWNSLPCVLSLARGDNFGFVRAVRAILTRGLKGAKSSPASAADRLTNGHCSHSYGRFHDFWVPRRAA